MVKQHRYVVAYDISEDDFRRKIRRICRAYGGLQQYSLFEMYLSSHQRAELIAALEDIVSSTDDYAVVKLYSVGPEDNDTIIGDVGEGDASNVV